MSHVRISENVKSVAMVEKSGLFLGPRDPRNLQDSRTPSTSRFHGSPGHPGPLDARTAWDLRTSEPLGNYLYRLNLESKHPEI